MERMILTGWQAARLRTHANAPVAQRARVDLYKAGAVDEDLRSHYADSHEIRTVLQAAVLLL